ncbi:MAG: hypothetical protein CMQ17_03735 [Gammaproteobacteria bacterium]|jgi:hypothetical protein|nr:hypothetical protein [Gammaproteobacteria bacterium]HJO11738.1 hypothetical protein [Gammaproteobacteria bacterium]|tara:strand:+ start:331 stop:537 length:207 start_codon:yes stop_codon:yes gene_type:complete
MPDPSYLLTSLIFSSIGLGYFIYGKKQKHKIAYYSGIGLIVYPYFVTGIPVMILTGIALMAIPKFVKL